MDDLAHLKQLVSGREAFLSIDPAQQLDFAATLLGRLEGIRETKPVIRLLGASRSKKVDYNTQVKNIEGSIDTLYRAGASGVTTVVDISGIGRVLYDNLKNNGVGCYGISAHAGEVARIDEDIYRPPKTLLISVLDAGFSNSQIVYDKDAFGMDILLREIADLRGKTTSSGNQKIAAKGRRNDDVVMALAHAYYVLCGVAGGDAGDPIYSEATVRYFEQLTGANLATPIDKEAEAAKKLAATLVATNKTEPTAPSRWRFRMR